MVHGELMIGPRFQKPAVVWIQLRGGGGSTGDQGHEEEGRWGCRQTGERWKW